MGSIAVDSSLSPGHVVVALRGELDFTDAAWVGRTLSVAAAAGSRVIVDLAGLAFMDCSGLSALVSACRQARHVGGDLALAAPQQPVAGLLPSPVQPGCCWFTPAWRRQPMVAGGLPAAAGPSVPSTAMTK
jgi:anti-anti-sigma factor